MNAWSLVRQLSFRQFLRLIRITLQNPLCIYPTLIATKRTMTICDHLYGKAHHKNGKANAVRHALWNILICKHVMKITKNKEKSIIWAKKITDLHEKLAPNAPIATAMDLHNNNIGRVLFLDLISHTEEEMIAFLQKLVLNAKAITEVSQISDYKNDLVYLFEA